MDQGFEYKSNGSSVGKCLYALRTQEAFLVLLRHRGAVLVKIDILCKNENRA